MKSCVDRDSSSLTRDDQDRIQRLLDEVRKEIEDIYAEREGK